MNPRRVPEIRLLMSSLAGGGAERVCQRLANYWASEGKLVQVILLKEAGAFAGSFHPDIELVDLNIKRVRYCFRKLSRVLSQHPRAPLIVFAFELLVPVVMAEFISPVKSAVTYRERSLPAHNIPGFLKSFYSLVLNRCYAVVAQSGGALQEMLRLGVKRPRKYVIPNPVPSVSNKPGCDPGALYLLAVGRLAPEKQYHLLIQGFAEVRNSHPKATLTILGEGPQRHLLEELIVALSLADAVFLPGFIADVDAYYRRASLLIISSAYEGQPNALIEALAGCCPVISVDCGSGVRELMSACGLDQFIIPKADFVTKLPLFVNAALSADLTVWQLARQRISLFCRLQTVADAYWAACKGNDDTRSPQ